MDHLPRRGPVSTSSTPVRHVCENLSFTEGDFQTFPARFGFEHLCYGDQVYRRECSKERSDVTQLEIVLQAWLFFNMLHLVLAPYDLYTRQDYLTQDGRFVHTVHLRARLDENVNKVRALSPAEVAEETNRLKPCFHQARQVLAALWFNRRGEFNRNVILSIEILCETLCHVAQQSLRTEERSWFCTISAIDNTCRRVMELNNWCSAEVAVAQMIFQTTTGRWYWEGLRRPKLVLDH